jgi:hypothetical protein
MSERGNLRRYPRFPYSGSIRIAWDDPAGYRKTVKAELLDLSEGGMRLSVPEAIPIGAYVFIDYPKLGISASASVRYCRRGVMKYAIGVEFTGGFRLTTVPEPET